jgi:ATP-binding cassette subfamily C protein CydD
VAYIIYAAFILKLPLSSLALEMLLLLAAIALRSVLVFSKERVAFLLGAKIRTQLRQELLQHISKLGPIHSRQFGTGELSVAVLEQVEAVQDFYAFYVPQMALVMLVPILILCVVFYFSWLSGLILLACGPLIPLFMALVGMGAAAANRRNFKALEKMSAHFLDVLRGLNTLKLFNRAKQQVNEIETVSDSYREKTMGVLRIAFMSSGVLEFFSAVSIALVAVVLGLSLLGHIHIGYYGHLDLFGSLFILLLAPEFFLPLRELGAHYHARAQAIGAAEGVMKILAVQAEEQAQPEKELFEKNVALQFQQVNFSYDEKNPVLSEISFSVAAGESIYLVGESGAGKTTVLNLIMAWLSPSSGSVLINGVDVTAIDKKQWLGQIAWIGQTPRLFHGSVRDNLLMAKPGATDAELNEALSAANAKEFVQALPQALDTVLAEHGGGLSGGQIQRLALARAFLKDAPLLLLDEPTANLDGASEEKVMSALERLSKGRTVITLTHHLSQLPAHARVLLLADGKISEEGVCADLLIKKGLFAEIYQREQQAVLA